MRASLTSRAFVQALLFGGLWVLIPLINSEFEGSERIFYRGMFTMLGVALVVLLNLGFLLPRVYFRKQPWLYVLLGLLAVLAISAAMDGLGDLLIDHPPMQRGEGRGGQGGGGGGRGMSMRHAFRAMPCLLAFVGSALFELAAFGSRQEKEATRMRNEKLETEMKFLKSQINPHFLFNTLNNIYSLAVIKSDAAPENLLKLSAMLRYMLYECNAERVPLHKEIEYLKNYIALQLLKDSRGLNVRLELDESRPNLLIAPMLFIPFVENAFKHSKIEDLEKGFIHIELKTGEKHIVFKVENSRFEQPETRDRVGGIGLQNVRRQLELLYPGRHELRIEPAADRFSVTLRLDLP